MADARRAGSTVIRNDRGRRTESARPLLIGLTGPIGCGKSTIASMLEGLGGTVIDADVLARRATDPGRPTLHHIRERFGAGVFSGDGLDRAALARIVFDDSDALRDLERIVHPEVRKLIDAALETAESAQAPFVVIEAIKLVEGGLSEWCDEVWIVECSSATQLARLRSRGVPPDDAERRVRAQGDDLVHRLVDALGVQARTLVVRRLSTDGSPDETRERAENALADALAEMPRAL